MKDFNTFFVEADEAQSLELQRVAERCIHMLAVISPSSFGLAKLPLIVPSDLAQHHGDNSQADQDILSVVHKTPRRILPYK